MNINEKGSNNIKNNDIIKNTQDKYEKIIDVVYNDINDIYITAPQIGQKLQIEGTTIRYWATKFGDLIGVETDEKGWKKYRESHIERFAFIQELIEDKHFSYIQVREYISKHGFKYAEYDSGLMNPKDPLGFQALASALSVEMKNQFNEFALNFSNEIVNQVHEMIETQCENNLQLKAEIEASVDSILDEKIEEMSISVFDMKGIIENQTNKQEQRDIDIIDKLKKSMEEQKNIIQEQYKKENEDKNKKGLFSKIFKK